jgi:hypothetical protein
MLFTVSKLRTTIISPRLDFDTNDDKAVILLNQRLRYFALFLVHHCCLQDFHKVVNSRGN